VDWRELRRCLKTDAGANAVISLDIEGARHLSIVKEIQRHPVRRDVVHVDFLRVDAEQTVVVEVPVLVIGEAKKVANMQGIVEQLLFKISVESRPDAIPNEITIDVSELELGDTITVADLQLPAGAAAVSEADATVVQGSATRSTVQLQSEAAKGTTDEPESAE
jgi:large subunit ribosomal protein L25